MARIAISGTGFIGRGLAMALGRHARLSVSHILTRRSPGTVDHPCKDLLTDNRDVFLDGCDLVVECSGDVLHSAEVIHAAQKRSLPVVTMNSEFHVTVGSALVGEGYLTEAEGDQPGCLAALDQRTREAGFSPLVYGNIKGFLDINPSPDQMQYWAQRQGISLAQVTAFTDGSKVQIEQAFAANGLGAGILAPGLKGPESDDLEAAAFELAQQADQFGGAAISDYVLQAGGPAGVFIVARHDPEQQPYLQYLKLGEGPYYLLLQPFHLCHLEMLRTIEAVLSGAPELLNNGSEPAVGIRSMAKRSLPAGHLIKRGLGSFDLRGEAMALEDFGDCVPLGLVEQCTLREPLEAGECLTWDHVSLPASFALDLFQTQQKRGRF